MNLQNKNIIYVGGFGGIGYASCKCFLENGVSTLCIFDVNNDPQKLQTLQSVNKAANVFYQKINLTDKQSIDAAFADALGKIGCLDVLVNGSGIMNEHLVEQTIQINLLGAMQSTYAAMQYMDKSKGGNGGLIVNVASVVGLDAYGAYAAYTASKYGIIGFGRALSDPFYYSSSQIGFITICPSTTETPMLASLRINSVTTFPQRPPLPNSLRNDQTAADCGRNLVEAVKTGKNGSVWILCAGELKEYEVPKFKF